MVRRINAQVFINWLNIQRKTYPQWINWGCKVTAGFFANLGQRENLIKDTKVDIFQRNLESSQEEELNWNLLNLVSKILLKAI
jgi:hypothetical protein